MVKGRREGKCHKFKIEIFRIEEADERKKGQEEREREEKERREEEKEEQAEMRKQIAQEAYGLWTRMKVGWLLCKYSN
jgi:protein required for attachment to host cells